MSKFTTEFLFFYIYYIEVGIWNIEISDFWIYCKYVFGVVFSKVFHWTTTTPTSLAQVLRGYFDPDIYLPAIFHSFSQNFTIKTDF